MKPGIARREGPEQRTPFDVIVELLDLIDCTLPESTTIARWFDDGADWDVLRECNPHHEAFYALGYLRALADARGQSVLALIASEGIDLVEVSVGRDDCDAVRNLRPSNN